MGSHMSPVRLLDCYVELFAYIVDFRKTCVTNNPSFEDVTQKVKNLLAAGAKKAVSLQIDPRDYDLARFAVCAWIDETMMNVSWMHSSKWRHVLLQTEHYGTVNAGTEFFDRLGTLRSDQQAVREIYFMCLGFGFLGQYSLDKDSILLNQLKKSNLKSLNGKMGNMLALKNKALFETAYNNNSRTNRRHFGEIINSVWSDFIVSGLWIIPPIVGIALYFLFNILLDSNITDIMLRVVDPRVHT